MSGLFETWGYRRGEARLFELSAGAQLPRGWYDSPARVPSDDLGPKGEAQTAVVPTFAASPPSLPSIEQQEAVAYAELVAENVALKARVASLEESQSSPVPPTAQDLAVGDARPMTPIEKARAAKAAKRERDKL